MAPTPPSVRIPASSVCSSTLVTLAAALGVPEKHIGPRATPSAARAADGASVEVGDVLIGIDGQLLDPTKEVRPQGRRRHRRRAERHAPPPLDAWWRRRRLRRRAPRRRRRRPPAPATPPPAPRAAA